MRSDMIMITVTGVCGSGKSTLTRLLRETLASHGFQVTVDDVDSAFVDQRSAEDHSRCVKAISERRTIMLLFPFWELLFTAAELTGATEVLCMVWAHAIVSDKNHVAAELRMGASSGFVSSVRAFSSSPTAAEAERRAARLLEATGRESACLEASGCPSVRER